MGQKLRCAFVQVSKERGWVRTVYSVHAAFIWLHLTSHKYLKSRYADSRESPRSKGVIGQSVNH